MTVPAGHRMCMTVVVYCVVMQSSDRTLKAYVYVSTCDVMCVSVSLLQELNKCV
jgi:hypothetical protein